MSSPLLSRLVVFPAAAALVMGAATAVRAQTAPLEDRVNRLEAMVSSGTLIELLERVEALQREVQTLRGEIEEQTHDISQLKRRQRELYLDVDGRLGKLEAGVPPVTAEVPVEPQPEDTTAAAGSDSGDLDDTVTLDSIKEQDAYQSAFNLLKTGRYDEAGEAFQRFLGDYGQGRYADNAQYWLGETFYVRQRFEEAIAAFETLTRSYPDSAKYPHALLKIGYSQAELGRYESAAKTFEDLISQFPQTPAARNAESRLAALSSAND